MTTEQSAAGHRFHVGAALAGAIFIVLGALFMLDALDVASIRRDVVLPIVLIALGVAVMLSALARPQRSRR